MTWRGWVRGNGAGFEHQAFCLVGVEGFVLNPLEEPGSLEAVLPVFVSRGRS